MQIRGELLVDYDWIRLQSAPFNGRKVCCELADIEGEFDEITLNILPYTPKAQLLYDLQAASNLLSSQGTLTVNFFEKRLRSYVKKLLRSVFREVVTTINTEGWLARHVQNDIVIAPPLEKFIYTEAVTECPLTLWGRPGLFAANKVDAGTELLLQVIQADLSGTTFLDIGCGCGPIGLVASRRGAEVTMIDMDYRAILCTRMGLKSNNLSAQTVIGDGTEDLPPNNYDLVVSNPPTHAGSVKLRELFEGMVRVMRIEGKMLIVLRQHLNYEKWLSELGQVDTLSVEKGYKMLQITNHQRL